MGYLLLRLALRSSSSPSCSQLSKITSSGVRAFGHLCGSGSCPWVFGAAGADGGSSRATDPFGGGRCIGGSFVGRGSFRNSSSEVSSILSWEGFCAIPVLWLPLAVATGAAGVGPNRACAIAKNKTQHDPLRHTGKQDRARQAPARGQTRIYVCV